MGDAKANARIAIGRDRDTRDGGRKGEMTTDPVEVDDIVKRGWKVIYDGMAGNMEQAVA